MAKDKKAMKSKIEENNEIIQAEAVQDISEDVSNTEETPVEATKAAGINPAETDPPENSQPEDNPPEIGQAETGLSENAPEAHIPAEEAEDTHEQKKKHKKYMIKVLRLLFTAGFIIFAALFLNEVFLQPYLANKASSKAKDLYAMPTPTPIAGTAGPTPLPSEASSDEEGKTNYDAVPTPDPNRDSMGRLLQFKDLLNENQDVKGWIKIDNLNGENDTKINYVVVQSGNGDPEYYLTRDWEGNKVKAGSLFLDHKSSVETNTPNLVIHGHNMTSTDDMFHYLLRYNKKEYYDSHPIIDFNTIYRTGQWKIFSVFITNGSSEKEPFFDYTQSSFRDSSDFLNFVYNLRIRSIFNADDVDINENDQLLTLSTCSYEVKDYRTVIVARRVREGEDPTVNTDNVFINPEPLYPGSYYYRYGGKAPKLPGTFEEALEAGAINWYTEPEE